MPELDEYITITQAAAEVGYSRVWIRTLAARGAIPSTRKARLILVHLPSLREYRERQERKRFAQPQEPADGDD